jgi:hypothetical protein
MGWAFLPPLQRSLADAVLITRPQEFPGTLPSWRNPGLTGSGLTHLVSPAVTGGVIDGDGAGTPVQRAATPELTLLPPEPTKPTMSRLTKAHSGSTGIATSVQREVSASALPAAPVVAAPAPTLTRTSTEALPVVVMRAEDPTQLGDATTAEPVDEPTTGEPAPEPEPVRPLVGTDATPVLGAASVAGSPSPAVVQRIVDPAPATSPPSRTRFGLGAPLAGGPERAVAVTGEAAAAVPHRPVVQRESASESVDRLPAGTSRPATLDLATGTSAQVPHAPQPDESEQPLLGHDTVAQRSAADAPAPTTTGATGSAATAPALPLARPAADDAPDVPPSPVEPAGAMAPDLSADLLSAGTLDPAVPTEPQPASEPVPDPPADVPAEVVAQRLVEVAPDVAPDVAPARLVSRPLLALQRAAPPLFSSSSTASTPVHAVHSAAPPAPAGGGERPTVQRKDDALAPAWTPSAADGVRSSAPVVQRAEPDAAPSFDFAHLGESLDRLRQGSQSPAPPSFWQTVAHSVEQGTHRAHPAKASAPHYSPMQNIIGDAFGSVLPRPGMFPPGVVEAMRRATAPPVYNPVQNLIGGALGALMPRPAPIGSLLGGLLAQPGAGQHHHRAHPGAVPAAGHPTPPAAAEPSSLPLSPGSAAGSADAEAHPSQAGPGEVANAAIAHPGPAPAGTEVPVGGTGSGEHVAAGAAGTAAAGNGGAEDVEALAQKLLAPLMRRIRAEMLLDRERRGLRTDSW